MRRVVSRSLSRTIGTRAVVTQFKGTAQQFQDEVSKGPTMVDFYTDWCGPCKMIAPKFAELSDKFPDVKFLKVNVDEEDEIAAGFSIRSIPTFRGFSNGGKPHGSAIEGANLNEIEKLIKSLK